MDAGSATQAAQSAGDIAQHAAGAVSAASSTAYSMAGYFWAIGIVFLILGILWILLYLLKRKGSFGLFGLQSLLQIEGRMSLGPKQSLIIVRYEGKRLLLGLTEGHIIKLAESEILEEQANKEAKKNEGKVALAKSKSLEQNSKNNSIQQQAVQDKLFKEMLEKSNADIS